MLYSEKDSDSSESDGEVKPRRCGFCDFASFNINKFIKHFKTVHYKLPVNRFPCEDCEFTCNKSKELKDHRKIHARTGIVCEKCDAPCDSLEALREHTGKVHSVKRYTCYYCGLTRTYKVRIRKHMVYRHIEPKNFVVQERKVKVRRVKAVKTATVNLNRFLNCQRCPYKTTSQLKFVDHQHKHVERHPNLSSFCLKCNDCAFQTTSVSDLRDHVKTHARTLVAAFQCAHCAFRTTTLHDLKSHEKKCQPVSDDKRRNGLKASLDEPPSDDKENTFFCTEKHCDFTCSRLTDLADHSEITHRNDAVYDCCQCHFTTRSLSELTEHEATHVLRFGIYACDKCPHKTFNYVTFKRHVKAHKVSSDFECSSCEYSCRSLKELLTHQQTHADEDF